MAQDAIAAQESSRSPLATANPGPVTATDVLPSPGAAPLGILSGNESKASAIAQISAANDNGQATIKITNVNNVNGSGTAKFIDAGKMIWKPIVDSWSIALSAPTNASAPSRAGAIATETLPASFQVKFAFSQFRGSVVEQHQGMADVNTSALSACEKVRMSSQGLDAAKAKLACFSEEQQIGGADKFIDKYRRDLDQEYKSYATKNSGIFWGADGAAGYNSFTFYDPATAVKSTQTDPPWTAEGFFGYAPNNTALLLLESFGYQTSYTAQMTGTLCPVSATAKILKCVSGALGAPEKTEAMPVSFEPRWQLGLGTPFDLFGITTAAFDPKMSYDIRKGVYGFNTQISFGQSSSTDAQASSKSLSGGIQFGWQSDKHQFVVGLFVGAPFSLFSVP